MNKADITSMSRAAWSGFVDVVYPWLVITFSLFMLGYEGWRGFGS